MKRLVIVTVGKTHSGKTTFARELEQKLENSFVMDQDNHAEFINTYYKIMQPKKGPNTLKHAISRLIVEYAKDNTNLHLIISNSNRSKKGRSYLLNELFPKSEYTRILVHFDIPDEVLQARVENSKRSTNIFRGPYTSFVEVLKRQQIESSNEDVLDPAPGEADYLFVIQNNREVNSVIEKIIKIAQSLN
ncbi:AAA family ATPase [Ureibacillus acetophenoni]|uniref:AAA domain-containing protein n=1 Tax=Ureibacillus acetophenoni TaxID=614649 RepID=A0A285UDJ3_9BACL|nr:AAA family ATPase [Ureibacillus acetophenoni]SOC39813.1 AAA domain-containing protein [Ureibacillus acetophenoni]